MTIPWITHNLLPTRQCLVSVLVGSAYKASFLWQKVKPYRMCNVPVVPEGLFYSHFRRGEPHGVREMLLSIVILAGRETSSVFNWFFMEDSSITRWLFMSRSPQVIDVLTGSGWGDALVLKWRVFFCSVLLTRGWKLRPDCSRPSLRSIFIKKGNLFPPWILVHQIAQKIPWFLVFWESLLVVFLLL